MKSKMIQNKKNSKIVEGTRLAYDAKRQMLYRKKLKSLTDRMTKDVTKKILSLFRSNAAEEFKEDQEILSAMDESISSMSRILMNKLNKKWQKEFASHAKDYAEQMVKGELVASNKSLTRSLKSMSVDVTLKSSFIPRNIREVAKASIAENIGLIKSIPDEYMQKVTGTVMRAITSGGNIQLIQKTLSKYTDMTERRIKNIADDQTRKAYNTVNHQRMMDVGVKSFMWLHSGGGQKPRKDHIAMNGKIFSFDDLPVIDERTGETGIPGQAVNCFLGSTKISLRNGCRNLWRYWHEGEIVSISIGDGDMIESTLNHPVLTLRGWLPANEIQEGDYLIGCEINGDRVIDNEDAKIETTFDKFFDSLGINGAHAATSTEFNFHGDIPKYNVDSIGIDNILPDRMESIDCQQLENLILSLSDIIRNNFIPSFDSKIVKSGGSGTFRQLLALFLSESSHPNLISFAPISQNYSILFKNSMDHISANLIGSSDADNAFAIIVTSDNVDTFRIDKIPLFNDGKNIIKLFLQSGREMSCANFIEFAKTFQCHSTIKFLHRVEKKIIRIFSGHVYTMESFNGWYSVSAAQIISKNCGCTMKPIFEFELEPGGQYAT